MRAACDEDETINNLAHRQDNAMLISAGMQQYIKDY